MPREKKKKEAPPIPETDSLPERFVKLKQEVKSLRELLKQEVDRAARSVPEEQDVLVGILKEQWVALPVAQIVEVLPRVLLAPLPEVPPYVQGSLLLRGTQVPVIDLAARMGEAPLPIKLEDRIIILNYRKQLWGLLLTSVEYLERIAKTQLNPIPAEIPSSPFAIGLWASREHSTLLLSVDHLINPVELAQA